MAAGSLIAPKTKIQNSFFDKMVQLLNNVPNNKHKAAIIHYLIIYLHLFEDGNGRTARLFYDLLADEKIHEQNLKQYLHNTQLPSWVSSTQRDKYYSNRNLAHPFNVGNCASTILFRYLLNNNLIKSEHDNLLVPRSIRMGVLCEQLYFSDDVKKKLSAKTVFNVERALTDNNEDLSLSALAVLMILTKKGTLQPLINYDVFHYNLKDDKYCKENGVIINELCIEGNSPLFSYCSQKLMGNWKPKDYICVIDLVDTLKESLLDLFIDFAEHPNSFKYQDNLTMIDAITERKIPQAAFFNYGDDFRPIILKDHYPTDTKSRLYHHIEELQSILDNPRYDTNAEATQRKIEEEIFNYLRSNMKSSTNSKDNKSER